MSSQAIKRRPVAANYEPPTQELKSLAIDTNVVASQTPQKATSDVPPNVKQHSANSYSPAPPYSAETPSAQDVPPDDVSFKLFTAPTAQPELVQSPTALSSASTDLSLPAESSSGSGSGAFKSFYEEARHFAGGLMSHPYECNKKYAILRHSHGLVYYQGPATSVAITIFSVEPLPPDRTIFMQRKGWTGQRGMKVRSAVGINAAWINVTPSLMAPASAIKETDERAWQRDISKFERKRPNNLGRHVVRETNIVRVPHDATDGYFRLLLCAGDSKKVLCPSPVFRVASTSTSASSIKGASLSTLPLELGIKIGSFLTTDQLTTVAEPVTSAASTTYNSLVPGWARTAAPAAYNASGVGDKVGEANDAYTQRREESFTRLDEPSAADPSQPQRQQSRGLLGPFTKPKDESPGPQPPYPLHLSSTVAVGTGRSVSDFGLPTANLAVLPGHLRAALSGVYFAWARIDIPPPPKKPSNSKEPTPPSLPPIQDVTDGTWKPALVTVSPSPWAPATVAPPKTCRAHLLMPDVSPLVSFIDYSIRLYILGYLHPAPTTPLLGNTTAATQAAEDIFTIQHILASPGWTISDILAAQEPADADDAAKGKKTLTERYIAARAYGQDRLDRVPLHRLGVRTDSQGFRDREFENGGICIRR